MIRREGETHQELTKEMRENELRRQCALGVPLRFLIIADGQREKELRSTPQLPRFP
jgi:hypothetical protein